MPEATIIDTVEELEQTWATAETRGDVATLEAIATPDFMLVGPAGFVLDKQQWLDRYRNGDLTTQSLVLENPVTRTYGEATITVARHVQQAEYQGHPANGEFRATHITVRDHTRWRLAGMHLSPIGSPPPFAKAQRVGAESDERERKSR